MKKILIITLITLINITFAQGTYTKVTYKELSDINNILLEDNFLFFNKDKSLFIPNHKKWETKVKIVGGSTIYPANTIDSIANKPRFIFYDTNKKIYHNNLIYKDIEYILKDDSRYQIKWQDTDEYKNILNHKCRKAIAISEKTGKARKYIVWYSTENKNKVGPLKFNNIGGLVLELQSEDNFLHFVAEKIETITENPFELVDNYDFSQAITLEEYATILDKNRKIFEKNLNKRFGRDIKIKSECKDCN